MKLRALTNSFTGGIISPELYGRSDLPFYAQSLKECHNAHPIPQGGVVNRPGSYLVAKGRPGATEYRLFAYIRSDGTRHVLRLSNLGWDTFSTSTPTTDSGNYLSGFPNNDLDKIVGIQVDSILLLIAPDGKFWAFTAFAGAFDLFEFTMPVPPNEAVGDDITAGIVNLSGSTLTALLADVFSPADVGRQISYNGTIYNITAYTDARNVTVSSTSAISGIDLVERVILDSQQAKITPSGDLLVGGTVTLTATTPCWMNTPVRSDIGRFIEINDGLVEIKTFTSSTVVSGVVVKEVTSNAPAFPGGWKNRSKVTAGIKSAVLHGGRLVFGGFNKFPTRVFTSVAGDYFNFATGLNDSDAIVRDMDSKDGIKHMISMNVLYVFTGESEHIIRGTDNGPITPLSIVTRKYSEFGCADAPPVICGQDIVYVQRSGNRLRSISFSTADDGYQSLDLTIRAPDILSSGVARLVHAQVPYQLLWVIKNNGKAALMCIDKESGSFSWSTYETQGEIMDAVVIADGGRDDVYMVVKRIGPGFFNGIPIERADHSIVTDCSQVLLVSGNVITTGLSGSVYVIADGSPLGVFPVVSGQITLPEPASVATVGYFSPSRIVPTPLEFNLADGSILGESAQISSIKLQLVKTRGLQVNGHELTYFELDSTLMDTTLPEFSGVYEMPEMGWNDGFKDVVIEQNVPLRFMITALKRVVQVN